MEVLLCTFLVSTNKAEISFSTFQKIKSWLHSAVGEEHLNGQATWNVNSVVERTVNKALDALSGCTRKLDFVL